MVPKHSTTQRYVSLKDCLTRHSADILLGGLGILLWLRLLMVPVVPHGTTAAMLDSSWMYCNAYFLKHGFHAGVDYVFPTTLLGYFFTSVYDPELFWWYLAFRCALYGLLAYNLFRLAKGYGNRRLQAGFLLACGVFIPFEHNPDIACYMLLIAITQLLLGSKDCKPGYLFVNLFALNILGFMKFTFFIAGGLVVICASLANKRLQRPWYANPAGIFTLLFFALWLLLKQPISTLPMYFKNMTAVSAGYSSAMGLPISADFMVLSVLILFAVIFMAWKIRRGYPEQNALSWAILSLILVEVWKHSFVRADGHVLIFFGCMTLVPLLLPVYFGACRALPKWQAAALIACALLSLFSYFKASGREGSREKILWMLRDPLPISKMVFAPLQGKQNLDAQYMQEAQRWHLPAVDAYVGAASIDVISTSQFVVFLNNLNYRPRPVYLSYSAFMPGLLKMNGDFYRGSQAPAFILLNLYPIDQHWPLLEDSDVMQELAKQYRPVLSEKGFVLFERQAGTSAVPSQPRQPAVLQTGTARSRVDFGTEIPLTDPAAWHLLSVHTRPTLAGKLRDIAVRQVPIYIIARLEDGTQVRRRLIPGMAETNFLLDPYVDNTGDFIHLYHGAARKRVRSFKLEVDSWKPNLWMQPQIEVYLTSCPPMIAHPVTESELQSLLDPRLMQEPQE